MNIRFRPNKTLLVLLWICLLLGLPVQVMAQTCSVDNEVDLAPASAGSPGTVTGPGQCGLLIG